MTKRLIRLSIFFFCTYGTVAAAQTYDPRTGIAELPGSPLSPTSSTQCDTLQQQWSQLIQALEEAHQKCLDAHSKEPEDPRASFATNNPICSHAECQSLHTARMDMKQKGDDRVQTCRAGVSQFQKNQQIQQQQQEQQAAIQQALDQEEQQALARDKWQAAQLEKQRREANEKIAALLAANAKVLDQNLRAIKQMEAAVDASSTGTNSVSLPPMTPGESQMLQGLVNGDGNSQNANSSSLDQSPQASGQDNSTQPTSDSPTAPATGPCGVDISPDVTDARLGLSAGSKAQRSSPRMIFVAFAFSTLGLHGSGGDGACGVGIDQNEQKAIDQSGVGCAVVSRVPDRCGTGNGGHYQVCKPDRKTRWVAIAVSNDGDSMDWSDGEAIGALTQDQAEKSALANCGRSSCQLRWSGAISCTK